MRRPRSCLRGRERSVGGADRDRFTGLTRGRVLLVAGVVALASLPVGAGAQDPPASVEEVRRAIDRVAEDWFASQQEAARLDAEIAGLRAEVAAARDHADRTATIARERAVQIYKGSGSVSPVPDGDDALESARRAELLDRANAQSHRAIDELARAAADLDARLEDLEARRAEQAAVAERLADQQAELEARLEVLRERAAAAASRARRPAATRPSPAARRTTSAPVAVTAPADAPASATDPPEGAGVHPRHDHPFLVCTRARESGGNYRAVNHSGGWYGAYQFALPTWDATAAHAGRDELIGVNPIDASPYDQDDLAWALYQWQGKRPWGGRC